MKTNCLSIVKILSTDQETTDKLSNMFTEQKNLKEFFIEDQWKEAIIIEDPQFEKDGNMSELKVKCMCSWYPPIEMGSFISGMFPLSSVVIEYSESSKNVGGVLEYRKGKCVYETSLDYAGYLMEICDEDMRDSIEQYMVNEFKSSLKEIKKTSKFKTLDKIEKYKFANKFKAERLKYVNK